MSSDFHDNSEMVDLAKPARLFHFLIIAICVLLVGVLIWLIPEFIKDIDLESVVVMATWLPLAVFPLCRSISALFLRPHFRANNTGMELRYWRRGWSILTPFLRLRHDYIEWEDICSVNIKKTKYKGITVDAYVIVECAKRDPIHIYRWVFNLSADAISNIIKNKMALNELRNIVPDGRTNSYVEKLQRHFAVAIHLCYAPSYIRIVGFIMGPPAAYYGWPWLVAYAGDRPVIDVFVAIGFCGGIGWLIFAIDEAVRSWRFRNKKFWLRAEGLSAGANEFSARVYGWHEIAGARRRVTQLMNQWDKPTGIKLEGIDILLLDGDTIWIPESYSKELGDLCEMLTPDDGTIHVDPLED